VTAPLGPHRPCGDVGCARQAGDGLCGAASTWHVMWTPDRDNSVQCDAHMAETLWLWAFYDRHPLDVFCTMPGGCWVWSWDEPPGCCAMEIDEETAALVHVAAASGRGTPAGRTP